MTQTTATSIKLLLVLGFLSLPPAGLAEKANRKSFSVAKGGLLQVSLSEGDIRISSWEKNEVQVSPSGGDDQEGLLIHQSGNSIRVESSGDWPSDGERVDISVPSQFDLELSTGGGDLEVNGPLTGNINGKTGGGDIRLGNIGGRINMSTSGGDITSGGTQGDVVLTTSGGDVRLGPSSGEVKLSTSGGEITVESVGKKLRATTSGGNITIGDVGGDATVSTAGGDVEIGVVSGNASMNTAGGNISLRGATGKVNASTAGGDLQLGGISGMVEGSTAGGNISATLSGTKPGSGRLTTAAGDIHLYVPENARVTISARIRMGGWWKGAEGTFDIRSDFKPEMHEKQEQDHEIRATYQLNGGGEMISLETMMGNIEIRKGRP